MRHGADTRAYGNRILGAALAAMLFVAGGRALAGTPYPHLLAQGDYLAEFNRIYQTVGTVLDTCRLCHPSYPLSNALNGFGLDFAAAAVGNHTFNETLESADSDGDGFSNLREIDARTFPGSAASAPPPATALTGLAIAGPPSVLEGGSASYTATATWGDGSTGTVAASWAVSPSSVATITAAGSLTALAVTSDQVVTVAATYTEAGIVRSAFLPVTIVNVPQVSFMPQDGADNVYVRTVVAVSTDGSADIRSVVDTGTFTLTVAETSTAYSGEATMCVINGTVLLDEPGYNDAGTEATFTPLCPLAPSTTYAAAIDLLDPSAPTRTIRWTFTTAARGPDSDGDGVQDGEDDHPHDNGKASPPSPRGTGKFLVDACGNAGIALAQCGALAQAEGISDMYPQFDRRGKPFGFDFPDGLVRYALTGLTPGATVTVTVSFPSGVPYGGRVFKVGADGFQEVLDAVIDGNRVTVTLTDGGSGDADGLANGVIVDPIGVAAPSGGAGTIDLSNPASTGAGCAVTGSGRGGEDALGSCVLIALAGAVLLIRKRKEGGA